MGLGFRARLEGIHDFIHGYFGGHGVMSVGNNKATKVYAALGITDAPYMDGTMNVVQLAAFDPVFWFHHTYVDYIYAEW